MATPDSSGEASSSTPQPAQEQEDFSSQYKHMTAAQMATEMDCLTAQEESLLQILKHLEETKNRLVVEELHLRHLLRPMGTDEFATQNADWRQQAEEYHQDTGDVSFDAEQYQPVIDTLITEEEQQRQGGSNPALTAGTEDTQSFSSFGHERSAAGMG